MPIYEYTCTACGHQIEALQKFSEAALVDCPDCGKSTLQKIVSATTFQLKGSGWYATDFRDKGKPPKDKATSAPTTSTSESKTETKVSDTKTDTTNK